MDGLGTAEYTLAAAILSRVRRRFPVNTDVEIACLVPMPTELCVHLFLFCYPAALLSEEIKALLSVASVHFVITHCAHGFP